MWQDIVLMIVAIFLSYALVPQIVKGFKLKRKLISLETSGITVFALYVASYVYLSLSLYFTTAITFLTGTLWLILFIQGITYKK
ncbi:hypothetical protein COU58_04400 [Candidatus Pacearchaeota archaeon CG10_big_fil_rev_8_21_14_0_10_32_42]|nr:MAG: hypothetical protein COU58_04400 [Candidatus Pacearchaeota archaeon CG10_big_fil_rev_8_21_14_0_10_32_42]